MATATQLKLRGLSLSVSKHSEALKAAQWVAELLGSDGLVVCADDVTKYISPKALGNSAGAIFSGPQWEAVGFKQSTRLERRTGVQRIWRLRNANS